jgi:hypothetical protein
VYGRHYDGKALRFEASGGLMHAALVMRDKETDTYWSIMTGDAIAGELAGTPLEELPIGEKAQWRDWVARHPDTVVLSVDGEEHVENNPYDNYFDSESGFRGLEARDRRLETKDPIYSFQLDGRAYAVPFPAFEGVGALFRAGGRELLLFRPEGVAIYYSTLAFQGSVGDFARRPDGWYHEPSGTRLDPERGGFVGSGSPSRLEGFDTFWYMWSLTHPDTEVLSPPESARG